MQISDHPVIHRNQQSAGSGPGQRTGQTDAHIADSCRKADGGGQTHDKFNHTGGKGSSTILHALDAGPVDSQKSQQPVEGSYGQQIAVGVGE